MSYYHSPVRHPRPHRRFTAGSSRGHSRAQATLDIDFLIRKTQEAAVQSQAVERLADQPIQHAFSDFALLPWLAQAISAKGYVQPTPIQDQAILPLLEGKDVVGIANTGTGKTAAFLIPILNKIGLDRSQRALIIAPTRELAAQIKDEAASFLTKMPVRLSLCIGGASMHYQIESLRRRPTIVIGTPGRLKDLYSQGQLDFSQFSIVVLDEVDRMLDMGFIRDIQSIISLLPKQRQALFFSATLSPQIRRVMEGFLHEPVIVSVKSQETAQTVEQKVVRMQGRNKVDVLQDILKDAEVTKAIVFGRTKHGVERLSRELYRRGFAVEALHGNKTQGQRLRALSAFKSDRVTVLLATDVAARGLDILDVSHVINYDLPATYEDYVHRIGRTGRAEKKGVAVSLIE